MDVDDRTPAGLAHRCVQRGVDTRRRVRRRARPEARRGRRSAGQAAAQAPVGAAARAVLRLRHRVLGRGDGRARVLEHPGVGVAHHRADRGGRRVPGDAVVPALPLAAGEPLPRSGRARPPAAAVGFGGPPADGRAGVVRTRPVLAARRARARPDAARRRTARADGGGQPDRGHHGGHRRRGGVDGAGRQLRPRSRGPTWRPPSARSPRSWTTAPASTTKWSPPQRNWCQRRTPDRCRPRRWPRSATATSWPVRPTGCPAGRRRSTNSATCAEPDVSDVVADSAGPGAARTARCRPRGCARSRWRAMSSTRLGIQAVLRSMWRRHTLFSACEK